MGAGGEDILLSPAAREMVPFSIECKNVERIDIWKAIAQAGGRKHPPLVVFRKNLTQPHVALPFAVFVDLLKRANEGSWQLSPRGADGAT